MMGKIALESVIQASGFGICKSRCLVTGVPERRNIDGYILPMKNGVICHDFSVNLKQVMN